MSFFSCSFARRAEPTSLMSSLAVADGEDAELNALLALRRELGPRLRLLGLMNGNVEDRLPAAKAAGVDWPQTHIADPAAMACPFGLPQSLAYFVLDKELRVVGITARAGAIGKRIAQLQPQ